MPSLESALAKPIEDGYTQVAVLPYRQFRGFTHALGMPVFLPNGRRLGDSALITTWAGHTPIYLLFWTEGRRPAVLNAER